MTKNHDQSFEHRLNRLEGQLRRLHETISAGEDCTDIIPQFLAVRGALASAFEEYVMQSLEECATSDPEKTKRLISLLARSR